jgi:hypothetical protein
LFDNRPPDGSADNEEPDGREQISWLRSLGDREALFQFMDGERQTAGGLEAAEALVELGDVRGLDHLIASLKSANSTLRHQSAQILKELNHPRGLRALREFRDEPGSRTAATIGSKLEAPREKLHDELEALGTDELVGLWHEKDRSKMSGLALDVLSEILTARLGELPPDADDTEGLPGDQIDEDVDPRIQDLWIQGDTAALMRIFEDTSDVRLQLEVAEALADLGNDDALEVLIEALDDPDRQINEAAAEMLDWLDLPRGNQALEDRGIEFETDPEDLFTEPESKPVASAAPTPSSRLDPWAAATPLPPAARTQQPPAARPLGTQTTGQQFESSASSAGVILVGAVGGVVGFIIFRFGLDVLGLQPLPADVGGWIQGPAIYYLGASVLAGAVSGTAGSRVAQAIGRRLGWEPAEGDLLPVLGALLEGATSAVVLNIFMTYFLKL